MSPDHADSIHTEREWLHRIDSRLADLQLKTQNHHEETTKRLEKVEAGVNDALPAVAARVFVLEEDRTRNASRVEVWSAASIGAIAAGVVGWFLGQK